VPAGQEPEFRPCSDPHGTHTPDEPLADGEYVFSVRAVDEYADRDPSPAEVSFTVEATAPKTTITRGPRELGNDPNPVFEFEADKPGVSFECRLDDGEWEPCSSPKDYEMLADGEHVFSVRATGALGNVEADPPQYAFTIDTVPPRTEIADGPRELGNDPNPVFEFEADKEGAEFECRLDDGEWEPCSSPVSYEGLDDGEHTFSVRAVGPTGKAEAEPQSHTFVIDTVAPQIEIDEPTEGAALTSKRATIAFTVNEEAQVSCRLAGEGRSDGFEPCSSPAAYEDLADGAYTFEVRAVDAAGNVGTASRAFRVVANACQRAEAEVSAAQKQLTKAQRAVKQAKSKLKALKRRRAPAAKVRRAKAKVKQANKALAAAKKRLANARGARVQACGAWPAPPVDAPTGAQRRRDECARGPPGGSGEDATAQHFLALLRALAALVLRATEEVGELLVALALRVLDVLLQPQHVVEALLGEPEDVVVLVLGPGDAAGLLRGHLALLARLRTCEFATRARYR